MFLYVYLYVFLIMDYLFDGHIEGMHKHIWAQYRRLNLIAVLQLSFLSLSLIISRMFTISLFVLSFRNFHRLQLWQAMVGQRFLVTPTPTMRR